MPRPDPRRSQPVAGGERGRQQAARVVRLRRPRHGPESESGGHLERRVREDPDEDEREGDLERRELDRAHDIGLAGPAQHDRDERDQDADRPRPGHREPHLLVGPGDGVVDGHDDRRQREGDHDQREQQVAGRLAARGHGHRHPAEHAGEPDHPEDQQQPAQGGAGQDQDAQRADRVGRDPLGRQRQAQEHADHRHQRPERPAWPLGLDPQPGEHAVRGEDERADVHVVHRDPALDEEHAVEQREQRDEHGDRPAAEQDPREQEQQPDGHRAHEHARQPPGERVVADVERRRLAVGAEREDLAPVRRRVVRAVVEDPGGRLERDVLVGEHALAMGLDDVDRRPRPVLPRPEDLDHLGRRVEHDARAGARHLQRVVDHGSLRGPLPRHRDDDQLRLAGRRSVVVT